MKGGPTPTRNTTSSSAKPMPLTTQAKPAKSLACSIRKSVSIA